MNKQNLTILFLGAGGVFRATVHCWNTVIPEYKIGKAIIIEPKDLEVGKDIPEFLKDKYTHMKLGLNKDNYKKVLDEIHKEHKIDLFIDLSVHISGIAMIVWAMENNVHYINTALEEFEEDGLWDGSLKDAFEYSIYMQEQTVREIIKKSSKNYTNKSMVIQMGQNPGCISLYALHAIDYLANEKKLDLKLSHAEKAKQLGLEVIHTSEKDTQLVKFEKKEGIFYNDWSPIGYVAEGTTPVQLGWGTHEQKIPHDIALPTYIDNQAIFTNVRGMDMLCKSFTPHTGDFVGRLIPHSENNTMSKYLETKDYRPSAYYVYSSSLISQLSLLESKCNAYKMPDNIYEYKLPDNDKTYMLTNNDITSGVDAVGALLLFNNEKNIKNFWCGSIIQKDNCKDISEWHNPTTQQVAAGVFLAIDWIMKNPDKGVNWPEDIYHEHILDKVIPILGKFYCDYVNYKPKSNKFVDLVIKN